MNPELWDPDAGAAVDMAAAAARVLRGRSLGDHGVSILGGEPFQQPRALAELCTRVKAAWPATVGLPLLVVYSGYTFEVLRAGGDPHTAQVLATADVLVDGPYIRALAADNLGFRGSSNQRVIDLPASAAGGRVVLQNWDQPRAMLTGGLLVLSPGMAARTGLSGATARHCGELPR